MAGFYPVSNGIDNGVEHLREKVNQGFSLMVFPEGTRSIDNSVKRFHKGAFFLAEEFNLDIVPVVIHGYSECSPKGDFMLYKASTTVEILNRIRPDDISFGENYTERTKKINTFFRQHFAKMRVQYEGANYFKSTLLNSFDYKESQVIKAVKDDFKKNSQLYYELNKFIKPNAKILHFANDFGQLDILLALQESNRKIDSFIFDENYRNVANTNNYLKKRAIKYLDNIEHIDYNKYETILISDKSFTFDSIDFSGEIIIINNPELKANFINKGFSSKTETNQIAVLKK